MTVREFLAELQRLPRHAEVLAFETGCQFCSGGSGLDLPESTFVLLMGTEVNDRCAQHV